MDKHLHIITHEVPWPPDFGGVIDLFYKLKALHHFGIRVHLHCFTKYRSESPILDKYCASVQYYPRLRGIAALSLKLPYIVKSRVNDELLKNLLQDHHPILFDGIHCTYYARHPELKSRKLMLRVHNIEHIYYQELAKLEYNPLKKLYYAVESNLLFKYEKLIAANMLHLPVSTVDELYLTKTFHAKYVHWLPVFLPWQEVASRAGSGEYCLYHGHLGINENDRAAQWLIQKVFAKAPYQLIIAGYRPSRVLRAMGKRHSNLRLIENPSDGELQELIAKAHVNVLPSFNNTGVKLKLLNALFNGRHCIANVSAVSGSGVGECCVVADSGKEFRAALELLYKFPFTEEDILKREKILKANYDGNKNAQKLIAWLY